MSNCKKILSGKADDLLKKTRELNKVLGNHLAELSKIMDELNEVRLKGAAVLLQEGMALIERAILED